MIFTRSTNPLYRLFARLGRALSFFSPRDWTLSAQVPAFYVPYLEYGNLPSLGEGGTEMERSGYRRGRVSYHYEKSQVLKYAGERYENVFQSQDAKDASSFRIFILGGSLAFGHGVKEDERFFSIIEKALPSQSRAKTIPAAVSGANSTQENVLFNLTVLPNRPDCVVILDGWNDVVLPVILCLRPGDPLNMSALYRKYYDLGFNFLTRLSSKSRFLEDAFLRKQKKDREDFIEHFKTSAQFREALCESTANIYLANLDNIIESCNLRGIPVKHFLQPSADVYAERNKVSKDAAVYQAYHRQIQDIPWANLGNESYIVETYQRILEGIQLRPWASQSVDLSSSIGLEGFTDPVHLNADGHRMLAQVMTKELEGLVS